MAHVLAFRVLAAAALLLAALALITPRAGPRRHRLRPDPIQWRLHPNDAAAIRSVRITQSLL
jgi:hypothetical protein